MFNERIIEEAVNWWALKINDSVPHDNGATNEEASFMACLMSDMIAMKNQPSVEKTEEFKLVLAELIREASQKYNHLNLYCDYGPGYLLGEAAKKVGINSLCFLYKTGMKITDKEVAVSEGYGRSNKIIYKEK